MRHAGFSLVELLVVLVLLAILLGITAAPAARWRDTLAVRAARDEIVSALAWTRMAAVSRGGAGLVIDPAAARFHTMAAGEQGQVVDLDARYGVILDSGNELIEVRYDALGIGRAANRTLLLRRGNARAGVVVSLYGRVRAW